MVYFVDHCQERIYTWITLRQLLYQARFSIHHFKEAIFRFERLMGVNRMKYNEKKSHKTHPNGGWQFWIPAKLTCTIMVTLEKLKSSKNFTHPQLNKRWESRPFWFHISDCEWRQETPPSILSNFENWKQQPCTRTHTLFLYDGWKLDVLTW